GLQPLTINTPNDLDISGKVLVVGTGADLNITSNEKVLIANVVDVNDMITITAGADSTDISFELTTFGSLVSRAGDINISGINDALFYGSVSAASAAGDIVIAFNDHVTIGTGTAALAVTAGHSISVSGG